MKIEKKVLATLVLDETGSMQKIKNKTISSVNEYIDSLKPQAKSCHITLVKFNSNHISTVCDNIPIKDCPKITDSNYNPAAMTPLLDAVGRTIHKIEGQLKDSKEGQDVLLVVATDGEENCSQEYDINSMAKLVAEKEAAGWTFVFLGANQDSWDSARSMGYQNVGNTRNWVASDAGIVQGMKETAKASAAYFNRRQRYYKSLLDVDPQKDLSKVNYKDANFYSESDTDKENDKEKNNEPKQKSV